ncbi:unnamed protein product [Vitrella brassicaformis CCMP3155]|uniref:Putative gamma-glutamylcyclotransferase n=1 Tax=Vitrella brassicaformis (strain CCMP3155) TaxID=1169540 RepID=A0A0G4FMJ5_VITBC|nr:unnamed protein product [Vitrella brassicaformis CCMP3155]|mmetsp:Transcript_9435/g.23080  ORF Transcript_9435/g.23080 Transcript_9435/m.23080 type:complete len:189 (-) Transcript_9435:242-808(-)|eukprot:CEM15373.1 unnamed protein product [Vitrella brassicaformis CCMP3155]
MASAPIFVYGSLMADEVLTTLLSRIPESRAASVRGFQRLFVKGQTFPAIMRADASTPATTAAPPIVRGRLLLDVTDVERQILDAFEDDGYEVEEVMVEYDDGAFDWRAVDETQPADSEGSSSDAVAASSPHQHQHQHQQHHMLAVAYVWPQQLAHQLDDVRWSYRQFRQMHLERFVRMAGDWRKQLQL